MSFQRAGWKRSEISAFEQDLSTGRLVEPHDAFGEGGFAAARFADQTERFAGLQGQRNAIDCLQCSPRAEKESLAHREVHAHITEVEQRSSGRGGRGHERVDTPAAGWSGKGARGGSSRQRQHAVA